MRRGILCVFASCILAGTLAPLAARAQDQFAGEFDGDTVSVLVAPQAGAYGGEIRQGQKHFPLKAHEDGGKLVGSFSTPDGDFNFSGTLRESGMTLTTGGATYVLKKDSAAASPLHAVRADAPDPASAADELPGYTLVTATEFGKAVTAEKPEAPRVTAALQQTFPDLARYFGERPKILGAYEDAKDHRTGGASFSAHRDGHAVNGFVSCKLGEKGATVAIVYCRADAPGGEWAKLVAKPSGPSATAPADVELREYPFPDDTGTVGIAEGWQTQSQSLMTGVEIKGPVDQEVNLAFAASVSTPDGPLPQMHAQAVANARQFGLAPPPPLPITLLIAPYTDPAAALKDLSPQISRISQSNGGPAISLDQIVSVQKVTPQFPNGRAALIVFDLTKTLHGQARHYRSGIRLDMTPIGPGGWMLYTSQVLAPRETYERDLPTMLAMAVSLKENPRVIMEKTRINIEAANARFAAQQQANKELQAAFDAQHRSWEHNQLVQWPSFADFDETIIGYRTVENTATGQRQSVDLGNVHDVVEHLNRYEPGRYKEVPLRDEMYPLPGR